MFTKKDLQIGDVLHTRDGRYYVYLSGGVYTDNGALVRVMGGLGSYSVLDVLNDDLTAMFAYGEGITVTEVYRPKHAGSYMTAPRDLEIGYKKVFDRNDIKELTVAQISELLGYEVKIVKEEK